MGFRLFKDTVELPCKLSGKTLYIGTPEYYKTYNLSWLNFAGLEFDWQQNSIKLKGDYLRGKLYNKTFELLIDGDMEITLIHRKSNLIVASFKPEKFIYQYFYSYENTDDFRDKRIGSYEMTLTGGLATRREQLIWESEARCFSNTLKSTGAGIANIGEDKWFSFLLVPSDLPRVQSCLVVRTEDAKQIRDLSAKLSPSDHILPLFRMYRDTKNNMYLQYENSDYSYKILERITCEYGRKVLNK